MKVILLEDVQGVGEAGSVANVADGYARNYLIPRKLAIPATSGSLKNLGHHRVGIRRRQAREATSADARRPARPAGCMGQSRTRRWRRRSRRSTSCKSTAAP
jgi:ribosomal protein L9